MNKVLISLLLLGLSGVASAHGLMPSRLTSPPDSEYIAYKFTATNGYKKATQFDVECFKNDEKHPFECKALPGSFWVPGFSKRLFKVQIKPDGEGVYLVCTTTVSEESSFGVNTRVCARWGVGVSPNIKPAADSTSKRPNRAKQHKPAPNTSIPPGN